MPLLSITFSSRSMGIWVERWTAECKSGVGKIKVTLGHKFSELPKKLHYTLSYTWGPNKTRHKTESVEQQMSCVTFSSLKTNTYKNIIRKQWEPGGFLYNFQIYHFCFDGSAILIGWGKWNVLMAKTSFMSVVPKFLRPANSQNSSFIKKWWALKAMCEISKKTITQFGAMFFQFYF